LGSLGSGPLVPGRYPGYEPVFEEFLLLQTGSTQEEASEILEDLESEGEALAEARSSGEAECPEPTDLRLRQDVGAIEWDAESPDLYTYSGLQEHVAAATGLSVVSDYFTGDKIGVHRKEHPLEGPIWRDLCYLGESGSFEWKLAGDCLVFHRDDWYDLAQSELPESFIQRWRTKLEDQGRFTLDDIVQLAVELEDRSTSPDRIDLAIPYDLLKAGGHAASGPLRGMLLLYHALALEERAAASSPEGLRLSQLSPRRLREITDHVLPAGVSRASLQTPTAEIVAATVFFMNVGSGEEEDPHSTQYEFRLRYPDDSGLARPRFQRTLTVRLALPSSSPGTQAEGGPAP
jgi:hypothetical protein